MRAYPSERARRRAAWLAAAGAAWALVLTVPFATAWHAAGYSDTTPSWAPRLRDALDPLLSFGDPRDVYNAYGRAFFPAFALALPAVYLLRRLRPLKLGLVEGQAFWTLRQGMWMALGGTIVDFWGEFADLRFVAGAGFFVETVGLLGMLLASVLLGLSALRGRWLPRPAAATLMMAGPLGVGVTLWPLQHVPSGPTLGLALAWAVFAVTLVRHAEPVEAGRPS